MLLCLCGLVLKGDPPQTCERCGVTVTTPAAPLRFDPVETIGWTTTDDAEATGAAW